MPPLILFRVFSSGLVSLSSLSILGAGYPSSALLQRPFLQEALVLLMMDLAQL
jgi:hypothetical protein